MKNLHFRKAFWGKDSMILWGTILLEILVLLNIDNNVNYIGVEIYTKLYILFTFGIIIIEFLLFLNRYMNYKDYYILVRYGNFSKFKKDIIVDISKFILLFVLIFNGVIGLIITIKFDLNVIKDNLLYLGLIVVFQTISFLIVAMIYIIIYLVNFNRGIAIIVSFIIYMTIKLLCRVEYYFIPPLDINLVNVSYMIKDLLSLFLIVSIYLIYSIDKGMEIHE